MSKKPRLIYGAGPVSEIIAQRPDRVLRIWSSQDGAVCAAARNQGVATSQADKRELSRMVGPDAVHQGIIAEVKPFEYADLDDCLGEQALVVALDGVTDPHNVGAILRSAYLLGASGVVIPENRAAKITPVVTKTSAGASELIPVALVKNLARALGDMKDAGLWSIALAAGPDAVPLAAVDTKGPTALVMGAEGSGIRPGVRKACDHVCALPMARAGVGSFNVSVAAGMALYEVARQRATE